MSEANDVGGVIKLSFCSKRGKQILKECGTEWRVRKSTPVVQFDSRTGPWWLIEPIGVGDDDKREAYTRWMHKHSDKDLVTA